MTRLSVNLNKVATLRNARGGGVPDLLAVGKDVLRFGAQGLTVHPRPDERHIRASDLGGLRAVAEAASVEFNLEGYPDARFMALVEKHRPTQATLVPDAPEVLTSDAGWSLPTHGAFVAEVASQLHRWDVRCSLFIEADPTAAAAAAAVGATAVELYTGPYAAAYAKGGRSTAAAALRPYVEASREAKKLGLQLNAGHDLNLANTALLIATIPHVDEVSIGHALIS